MFCTSCVFTYRCECAGVCEREGSCLQKQRRAWNPLSWSHRQLWVVHMSCQEPSSSPLKEQWVFFATEPSCHLSKLGSLLRPGARTTSLQKSLIDALGTRSVPFCVQRRAGTEPISIQCWTEGIFKKVFTAWYVNYLSWFLVIWGFF